MVFMNDMEACEYMRKYTGIMYEQIQKSGGYLKFSFKTRPLFYKYTYSYNIGVCIPRYGDSLRPQWSSPALTGRVPAPFQKW